MNTLAEIVAGNEARGVIWLLLYIAIIGVIAFLLVTYLPMNEVIKKIIIGVAAGFSIYLALHAIGLL